MTRQARDSASSRRPADRPSARCVRPSRTVNARRWSAGVWVAVIWSLLSIASGSGFHNPALTVAVAAEPAPTAASAKRALDEGAALLDDGKPAKARELVAEAAALLTHLAELDRPPAALRGLCERARELKDRLAFEGADVTQIDIPSSPRGVSKSRAGAPSPPEAVPTAPGPSFVNAVAPILVKHCGGCHVTGRRGDFQMPSYDALMKSGMVHKGGGASSRLVEVIVSGDMPRGGGSVPPADLATLVAWIDRGAAFDGPDGSAPLAAAPRPGAPPPPPVRGAVKLSPGDVSFAFEVAPVLLEHCAGCHDADDPEGGLRMVSLESLVRGGQTGPALVPGDAASSLLVRKLRGTDIEGQRMPLGKDPLPTETIDRIARWIDQGIKLDLLTPRTPLADVAAAGRARSLSHEELATARFSAAGGVWRRAIADAADPVVLTRDARVCIVSNLSPSRVEALAAAADRIEGLIADAWYGEGAERPLVKGGVVLFAFAKPYDYSDFWVNVIGAERPKGLLGGAGVAGDVAYGALVMPEGAKDQLDLDFRLAEQMTAAALVARGVPDWFASGAARVVAAKLVPRSALAKGWRSDANERIARIRSAADLVAGRADPADATAAGAAFFAASGGMTKLPGLLAELDAGIPFDAAFTTTFRGPPAAIVDGWLARTTRR